MFFFCGGKVNVFKLSVEIYLSTSMFHNTNKKKYYFFKFYKWKELNNNKSLKVFFYIFVGPGGYRGCEAGLCFHLHFSLFHSTSIAFHPLREKTDFQGVFYFLRPVFGLGAWTKP